MQSLFLTLLHFGGGKNENIYSPLVFFKNQSTKYLKTSKSYIGKAKSLINNTIFEGINKVEIKAAFNSPKFSYHKR